MIMAADKTVSDDEIRELEIVACPGCGSCSGMFTANSMNCLNEALGMALPGNGTVLATHKKRMQLFERAAALIVDLAERYYGKEDVSVLPRSIASKQAFLNAMALDIAMGGSTNTVLHLLAVAYEANVDFTLDDIDELSKRIPCLCKVSPSSPYHVEDVNRAGGIMSIMGELERNGLVDSSVGRVDAGSLKEILDRYDIMRKTALPEAVSQAKSAPGNLGRNLQMASQEAYYPEMDTDRANGCIRDMTHAYSRDGGLCVLFGNIARKGCIVKTAGVDPSILVFKGPAKVFFSQEAACEGILGGEVKLGDVVVIRYEGPKGGPGMQEMLYPTSYLKSMHLDKECALITDGRFSGGTSGLSICHISPEASSGGDIALVEDGDMVEIDIPKRKLNVKLTENDLNKRKEKELAKGQDAYKPLGRDRTVSKALKAYALLAASADKGAVRVLPEES